MIPFLFVAAAACLPHWLLYLAQRNSQLARLLGANWLRNLGTANGQFICIRRETYQRIGGHSAVANHLVEDVALARAVAAATGEGLRLTSCDGTALVQCRMYHSFPDLWEGFTKNLWPLFENDFAAFAISVLSQIVVFALPFFVVPWLHSKELWLLIGLILLLRISITFRYRTAWISVLVHPFGYLLAVASVSLATVWRAIFNVVRTRWSRAAGSISQKFGSSKLFRRSVDALSPTPLGNSKEVPGSQPVLPASESPNTLPSNQSDGAARRKRATRISRQTAESRTEFSQPRQRKMNKQAAGTASKLCKDHSEKNSRKMNKVATNTAKKTGRTKTKISAASSASLSPKISL